MTPGIAFVLLRGGIMAERFFCMLQYLVFL